MVSAYNMVEGVCSTGYRGRGSGGGREEGRKQMSGDKWSIQSSRCGVYCENPHANLLVCKRIRKLVFPPPSR